MRFALICIVIGLFAISYSAFLIRAMNFKAKNDQEMRYYERTSKAHHTATMGLLVPLLWIGLYNDKTEGEIDALSIGVVYIALVFTCQLLAHLSIWIPGVQLRLLLINSGAIIYGGIIVFFIKKYRIDTPDEQPR